MTAAEWEDPSTRIVQLLLGSPGGSVNGLVIVNGGLDDARVHLPAAWILRSQGVADEQPRWFTQLFDSAAPDPAATGTDAGPVRLWSGDAAEVPADSLRVYRC